MATMGECIELFNGHLKSTNYGNLTAGEYHSQNIYEGDNENWVYSGSAIISENCPVNKTLDIEFDENKFIRVTISMGSTSLGAWDGTWTASWEAYKDGEPYLYRDGEYSTGIGATGGGNFYINSPWIVAAFAVSGGKLEFMKNTIFVSDEHESLHSYSIGLSFIPNIYDDGAHYPRVGLLQPYDVQRLDGIMLEYQRDSYDGESLFSDAIFDYFSDIIEAEIEYDEGDDVPSGGGGGSYYDRNDAMAYPNLPGLGALDSGMVKLYAPTTAQMLQISSWLWSDDFFDNIIKNFSSPLDNIIGLYISPLTPNTVSDTFKIGNLDSKIAVNRVGVNYMTKNLGTLNVKKYYNSFADYENYRAFKLYLPFYGIVDISTDDFIGGSINVEYHIDNFSGTTTIMVMTTRNGVSHILHNYSTNIYSAIPFSGVNMMSFYSQMLGSSMSIASSIATGNIMGMASGVTGLISAHPNYGGSKSIGSTGGLMAIPYPYLIECRSIRDMPNGYSRMEGIPTNQVKAISTLSGYTEFESIRISAAGASSQELNEIERIMKEGVIL